MNRLRTRFHTMVGPDTAKPLLMRDRGFFVTHLNTVTARCYWSWLPLAGHSLRSDWLLV